MRKSIIFLMLFLLVSSCTVNDKDDSIKKILDRGVLIVGSDIPYGVMVL